jgi:hypothetical protein
MAKAPYFGFGARQRGGASAREVGPQMQSPNFAKRIEEANAAIAEPFVGITIDGDPIPGLFSLQTTGVSTKPLRDAAEAFLDALPSEAPASALFSIDSDAWRRWSNIHPFLMRHGAGLDGLDETPRERAMDLLRATLSADGFDTARDIMRLNYTIGEVTERWEEYGEWLYWVSIFGTPSESEPWGWQIDGHHLNLNCFVLGDQIVVTPTFMGSEPVFAETGKFAGTRVFEAEEQRGLELIRALSDDERREAVISDGLPGETFTAAFRDNFELKYQGIRCEELSEPQQRLLRRVVDAYVDRLPSGHDRVRREEVEHHLGETRFAWVGATDEVSPFYYRVHSPVILIEFDHQRGIAFDNDEPSRNHIHTVVRTPNGNDYGKDLLRQHYEQHHRP